MLLSFCVSDKCNTEAIPQLLNYYLSSSLYPTSSHSLLNYLHSFCQTQLTSPPPFTLTPRLLKLCHIFLYSDSEILSIQTYEAYDQFLILSPLRFLTGFAMV